MAQKITQKDFDEMLVSLDVNAKKLATLLYYSDLPDEIKESWITLLPEMSLEQMQKLLDILEANYLDQATKDIDEKYTKEFSGLTEDLKKEKDENDKKTVDLIKKISETL